MLAAVSAFMTILVCVPALVVIAGSGLDVRQSDDGEQFLLRALTLGHALSVHLTYPRWLPDLYLGFGYPVFSFYSPLAYLTVVIVGDITGTTVDVAVRVTMVVTVLFGALGTFLLARSLVAPGSRHDPWTTTVASLSGVGMMVASPYPFITNLFFRGDLPEAMALAWLPWFWLALRGLVTRRNADGRDVSGIVASGLAGAALILTHQLSALIAAAVAVIVVIGSCRSSSVRTTTQLVAFAGTVAIGITALFWMPLLADAPSVRLDAVGHAVTEVLDRLSPVTAPVRWVWPYPHGWDPASKRAPGGPVLPGITQLVVVVLFAGILLIRRVRRSPVQDAGNGVLFTVFGVVLVPWFLNLQISGVIWEAVGALRFIQFPWRLIGPLSLGVAMATAVVVARLPRMPGVVLAFVLVALMWAETLTGLVHPVPTADGRMFDDDAMVEADYAFDRWGASTTTGGGEFTPREVDIRRPDGSLGGAVRIDRVAPPGAWIGGLVMVPDGQSRVTSLQGDALRFRSVVETEGSGATIAFHQLAFPGWRATVDGLPVAVRPQGEVEGSGVAPGYLLVDVGPGRHEVAVWFGPTLPRLAGDTVSFLVILGLLWATSRHGGGWLVTLVVGAVTIVLGGILATEVLTLRSPARGTPERERIVTDVIGSMRSGTAVMSSPTGSALGPGAFLDTGWLTVRPPPGRPVQVGLTRQWLYMHPPGRVTVRLTPPEGAVFQAGLALRPDSWETPEGDGVHFVVEVVPVDGPGGMRTLLFQRINPRAFVDERRWVDIRADLGEWAGRPIDLTLRTDPVDSVAYDWAGWGNPVVVVPVGVLRPPNGPQPPASIHTPRTWMIDQ
ncbi:MAG: hypothetical protein RL022_1620 [Chloroflexota bacterium]